MGSVLRIFIVYVYSETRFTNDENSTSLVVLSRIFKLPILIHVSSSSLCSSCVPWLGEGLSMPSPNYHVLCFPLPYRVAPVFVQVVSPPLGWSPLSSFLVIWSPRRDTRGPSVVFEAVDMPCQDHFICLTVLIISVIFFPLPDPDVGLSICVCDVEHTSFHFCMCGRKFVLCLFGQCPGLWTICHSWQHTGVVHLSLQADGKVPFEDVKRYQEEAYPKALSFATCTDLPGCYKTKLGNS